MYITHTPDVFFRHRSLQLIKTKTKTQHVTRDKQKTHLVQQHSESTHTSTEAAVTVNLM